MPWKCGTAGGRRSGCECLASKITVAHDTSTFPSGTQHSGCPLNCWLGPNFQLTSNPILRRASSMTPYIVGLLQVLSFLTLFISHYHFHLSRCCFTFLYRSPAPARVQESACLVRLGIPKTQSRDGHVINRYLPNQ